MLAQTLQGTAVVSEFSVLARVSAIALVEALVKGAFVLLLSWALARLLCGSSARLRRLVWVAGLTSVLLFPFLPQIGLTSAPLLRERLPERATQWWEPPRRTDARSIQLGPARSGSDSTRIPTTNARETRSTIAMSKLETRWPELLVLAWLAGVVVVGSRYAFRRIALSRLLRRATAVDDSDWQGSLPEAKRALGLRRATTLLMSRRTPVSFAWGRFVVLPEAAIHWPKQQRDLVLLHELAHLQRRDHLGIVLAELVCTFHWMNPLVWLAARRLEAEREAAADEDVLATGARPSTYARVLLDIASRLSPNERAGQPAIARRSTIEERLLAILDAGRAREVPSRRSPYLIAIAFAMLSAAMASVPIWARPTPASRQGRADTAHRVVGSVQDARGEPVENARVFLRTRGDYSETSTNHLGRFEAEVDPSGPIELYVTAPRFAPWTKQRVDPIEHIDVVLVQGSVLDGVVLDARTREPVANVRVSTTGLSGGSRQHGVEPGPDVVDARTDEHGRFRLEGLAKGARRIWALASGYDRAEVDVAATHDKAAIVEVVLRPGSGITGSVRDPSGEPVAGATVRPVSRAEAPSPGPPMAVAVKTDARGRFELLGLDPRHYRLLVWAPEHAAELVPELELPLETTLSVDVFLSEGTTLTGRLIDEDGVGLSGNVRIPYLRDEEIVWLRAREMPEAETDPDGRFALVRVPPGRHELVVEPLGFQGRKLPVGVDESATQIDLGEVRFATGLTLEGHVVDEAGEPVAGADVHAFVERAFIANVVQGSTPVAHGVTRSDGSFLIAGLEPSAYHVVASSVGFASSEELTTEAGTSDVEVVLRRAGALRGRAVDVDGQPIPSFAVRLEEQLSGRRTNGLEQHFEDADGAFFIGGLSANTYSVTISSVGLKPSTMTRLEIPGPVTIDLGDVVVSRGGAIRGRVLDPDGDAVSGVTLTTYPEAPGGATATDGEGRFEILGFLDGVVDVHASHADYAPVSRQDVEVRAERSYSVVELRLRHGGRLEGRVRGRDGAGIAGRIIRMQSIARSRARGQLRSETDGSFVFDRLPVGRHRVELLSGDERLRIPLQEKEVRIDEAQTAFVEFESSTIQVSGYALKSGVPLSGAQITVRPAGARGGFEASAGGSSDVLPLLALTRADGFYELWVDHAGDYTVEAALRGSGARLPAQNVLIPDVAFHNLDLAFDSVAVAGRVTSAETQEPIGAARIQVYPMTGDGMTQLIASARSDGSGVFQLELVPGRYWIRVAADDYAPKEEPIAVEAPGADVPIELSEGRRIAGRVLDAEGRPPGLFYVHAIEDVGSPLEPPRSARWANVHPDGTFELADLGDTRYNVLAGSDVLGFAFAPGLRAGDRPVLRLRPAGWVDVVVRSPEGTEVPGAPVAVIAIQGQKARGVVGQTDDEGKVALYVPTGDLEIKAVGRDGGQGSARVVVSATTRASVEIHIQRAN